MASSRSRLVGRVMATLLVVGALFPMSASAQDDRGSCFRESGDKAISACNRAIKANPKDAQAYYSRGVEWRKKGQYGKAIADYSEAIRQDPTYVNAYYNRGIAWSNTGDSAKAIADYDEAIRRNPNFANAYYNRGIAWETKGNLQQALSDFRRFAELNPSDSDGLRAIARVAPASEKSPPSQAVQAPQQQQAAVQPQAQTPVVVGQGKRVALLIGNGKYQHKGLLKNPVNDTSALASALRAAGFQPVTVKNDLTREQTIQALRDFVRDADLADWAIVYYSGHGIELGGVNYVIPVDARLETDRDIALEAVDVGLVLNSIEGAKRLRLVILDACRDNPFASQIKRTMATRSLGKGLARLEPEAGTLVVYAAKHGETALDGDGSNSPFVELLVRRVQERPSLEVRRLFDVVRDDVLQATNRKQQPFSYGSLPGREDFYFVR